MIYNKEISSFVCLLSVLLLLSSMAGSYHVNQRRIQSFR